MAKPGNKFVAMCSIAVGLIYAGAYGVTAQQANPASAASVPSSSINNNNATTVGNTDSAMNSATSANSATSTNSNSSTGNTSSTNSSSQTAYKDGTYTGSGSDRRGTVEVAVTIAKGKISNVQITNYDMHYSESYIDGLPQEVVQRQNDNVDIVSGATSSSEDFQVAVQQALAQAQQSA